VPERRAYSDAEIDAAVAKLTEPERLEIAQRIVAHSAPQLQRILAEALDAGDWFGSAHEKAILDAAGAADPDDRMRRVRTLIAEETRVSMLVGVAVGLELGHLLLDATTATDTDDEGEST
jgi:hypothetical protein